MHYAKWNKPVNKGKYYTIIHVFESYLCHVPVQGFFVTIQSMEFSRPEYCSVAFPFSRRSSESRDQTQVSHIASGFFMN